MPGRLGSRRRAQRRAHGVQLRKSLRPEDSMLDPTLFCAIALIAGSCLVSFMA
jgi:hypothetical protein